MEYIHAVHIKLQSVLSPDESLISKKTAAPRLFPGVAVPFFNISLLFNK